MSQPSQQIAARYHLQLSDPWRRWFDEDLASVRLPGGFHAPMCTDRLVGQTPQEIWAGFMLPDTLPLVGNQYGDWICVRVEADGRLGELLHWYHGGGDWIPLGYEIAEAVVHDVVDHFRPIGRQMLRGAPESIEPEQRARVLDDFSQPRIQTWLGERLSVGVDGATRMPSEVSVELAAIEQALRLGDYLTALKCLQDNRWAMDVVACDRIQLALTEPKDWLLAGNLASEVISRRQDLAWAVNVAGASQQRHGNVAAALEIYFQGRFASAFSDQGVRIRPQAVDDPCGKFAIAQLFEHYDRLSVVERNDRYLQVIGRNSRRSASIAQVQEFWLEESRRLNSEQAFGESYTALMRAGWDMGVVHIGVYRTILEALVAAARDAGWLARQAVAQTHLDCLLAAQAR